MGSNPTSKFGKFEESACRAVEARFRDARLNLNPRPAKVAPRQMKCRVHGLAAFGFQGTSRHPRLSLWSAEKEGVARNHLENFESAGGIKEPCLWAGICERAGPPPTMRAGRVSRARTLATDPSGHSNCLSWCGIEGA
ncbi:hypothetical protein MTO96_000835 [Rhipicephalus appendiculatus]